MDITLNSVIMNKAGLFSNLKLYEEFYIPTEVVITKPEFLIPVVGSAYVTDYYLYEDKFWLKRSLKMPLINPRKAIIRVLAGG